MLTLARIAVATVALANDPLDASHQSPAPGEHVQVLGTQVSLAPPPGFTPAERYSGFESVDTGASVMVLELPGPYAEAIRGLTEEGLKRGGVKLLRSDKVDIAGRRGLLIHASQDVQDTTYLKWMGVFGDDRRSVQVVANYPRGESGVGDALRKCVLGAKWDRTLVVDPFAYLPFTIKVPGELKFFARLQNSLLFTRTGEANKDAPEEPLYSVTPSLGPAQVDNLALTAETRMKQMPSLVKPVIQISQAIEIGELKGWEIVADATDEKGKTKLVAYLVMLLDGEGYYVFYGCVGADQQGPYLPAFRTATMSFAPKPSGK